MHRWRTVCTMAGVREHLGSRDQRAKHRRNSAERASFAFDAPFWADSRSRLRVRSRCPEPVQVRDDIRRYFVGTLWFWGSRVPGIGRYARCWGGLLDNDSHSICAFCKPSPIVSLVNLRGLAAIYRHNPRDDVSHHGTRKNCLE